MAARFEPPRRVPGWLTVPAFAKINLELRLLGRRPDGYWEIRTVYQSVTLRDRVRLRLTGERAGLHVRVPGGGAPAGRANLVYRLLTRAARRLGVRRGIEVELEKNIPAARGLGGGSSDAAAALLGLLRLTGARLEQDELAGLGAQVGADVPFFFCGGRALGVGRGEDVHPLPDGEPLFCVLVCPPLTISTGEAYRRAAGLTGTGERAMIAASRLPRGKLWDARNDFEPVVFSRFPELARIKAALLRAGACQAGLSGSGSTVYGLFARRTAAERAGACWRQAAQVFVVRTLGRARYRQALGWGVVQR